MAKFIKLNIIQTENKYDDITKPYIIAVDNIAFMKETSSGDSTIVGLNNGKKYWTTASIDSIFESIFE